MSAAVVDYYLYTLIMLYWTLFLCLVV